MGSCQFLNFTVGDLDRQKDCVMSRLHQNCSQKGVATAKTSSFMIRVRTVENVWRRWESRTVDGWPRQLLLIVAQNADNGHLISAPENLSYEPLCHRPATRRLGHFFWLSISGLSQLYSSPNLDIYLKLFSELEKVRAVPSAVYIFGTFPISAD